MPYIDKNIIKKKYRAWDSNILSKLKIKTTTSKNKKRLLNKKQKNYPIKTGSKLEAKWEQTNPASDSITGSKLEAKWEQTNPVSDSITGSKLEAKWEQNNIENNFFSLSGLQRQIVIFIYELCKFACDKETYPLSIHQIAYKCKCTIKTVKNAINRLIKKKILFRNSFKNGRGGWTIYAIPNYIFQEILNFENKSKEMIKWEQSDSKLAPKLASELIATGSSSSIYIKTTTGDSQNSVESKLNQEWQDLDIEPLENIGFTITHLSQLAIQNKLSSKIVQDSIYAFAFDLEQNNRAKSIKGDVINYFMGILRNGKPYAPPSNYESPQDRAMRLYTEKMKEIKQKQSATEKEAISLSFNEWFSKLTDAQKKELLPENMRAGVRLEKNKFLESAARSKFEAEVWPIKKLEIVSSGEIPTQELSSKTSMATVVEDVDREVSHVDDE